MNFLYFISQRVDCCDGTCKWLLGKSVSNYTSTYIMHISSDRTWWRHQTKHFPRYWPFVRGIHRSPVNSSHKGQWRGALMFSLICAWINSWVNNHEAGDLRRHRANYDVMVMSWRDGPFTPPSKIEMIIHVCVLDMYTDNSGPTNTAPTGLRQYYGCTRTSWCQVKSPATTRLIQRRWINGHRLTWIMRCTIQSTNVQYRPEGSNPLIPMSLVGSISHRGKTLWMLGLDGGQSTDAAYGDSSQSASSFASSRQWTRA